MSQTRSYTMNPEGAKAAGQNNRIDETGPYVGVFTRAEEVTSKAGTEGIEFSFVDSMGRESSFLSIWTVKKDGSELSGRKMLDALMTCMRLRGIEPSEQVVEKWVNGAKVNAKATVFAGLMNKRVGLLLAKEPYEAADGSIKSQMVIECAFDCEGKRTAKNVLDQKPDDGTLDKMIERLRDRPLRKQQQRTQGAAQQRSTAKTGGGGGGFEDMDDDIPF